MNVPKTWCVGLALALGACSTLQGTSTFEPVWSQRPEEAGKLPVGRVVAIAEASPTDLSSISEPLSAGLLAGASLKPHASGRAAVGKAPTGEISAFRHAVRLRSGEIREYVVEYRFKVGDCVAIRSSEPNKYATLVSALPWQCDDA
jgi:hypothetical protein